MESALVDGAPVGGGDSAAQWETDVAGATGGAECPVRCQPCRGNANGGTGTPTPKLGESPCARAARDASTYGKGE